MRSQGLRSRAAGGTAALLIAAVARADFDRIIWKPIDTALDGTTPLTEIPGYAGQMVIEISARFDHPDDRLVGVHGTPAHPFQVNTSNFQGFVNSSSFTPNDKAPLHGLLRFFPGLQYDSFYTIGLRSSGPGGDLGGATDQLIVLPGTPGPSTDPWPAVPGAGAAMGWLVPPTRDGSTPTPQAVAGNYPEREVLILRLVIDRDPNPFLFGAFVLDVIEAGETAVTSIPLSFSVSFQDSFCCFPQGTCGPMLDERTCTALGGDFRYGVLDCETCDWACCLPTGSCLVLSFEQCAAAGGESELKTGCFDCNCPDIDLDGEVGVSDLIAVILAWGPCPGSPGCTGDVNFGGAVDVADLTGVITAWGPCLP